MGQAHAEEEARAARQPYKAQRRPVPIGSLAACLSCRTCLRCGRARRNAD